ncbi:MAG: aldo/keto reductase [Thermoplasmata archaeon]|nr:aldo/keto reductase [Thermoplasmata archaeon]
MSSTGREVAGHATEEGTREFAQRAVGTGKVSAEHFRTFGGLTVSSLGMGTYLGNSDARTDGAVEDAVLSSLRTGAVNVLDTAINYRYQRAERSVGRALTRAIEQGLVSRQHLLISTKNGYLAPDAESGLSPRDYVQQELIGTGALTPQDIVGGSHAMSRNYLRDQLARSLRNLGVSCVDLLYLHNAAEAQLEEVGKKVFFERLRGAFDFFEEARRKGRLVSYGLATWDSLRKARGETGHLSLDEVVRVAEEAGGKEHGFRFLQFPLNRMMAEAATLRNQRVGEDRMTLLDAAHHLRLGTFSSVPLLQGELCHGPGSVPGLSASQSALQFARSAPHHLAPLVGQKDPAHVEENLALSRRSPLGSEEFSQLLG